MPLSLPYKRLSKDDTKFRLVIICCINDLAISNDITFSKYGIVQHIMLLIVTTPTRNKGPVAWIDADTKQDSMRTRFAGLMMEEKLPILLMPSWHSVRPHLLLSWSKLWYSFIKCCNSHPGPWENLLLDWKASWSNPHAVFCSALQISPRNHPY